MSASIGGGPTGGGGLGMTSRRQSRELALQVLFQAEFSPQQSVEVGLDTFRQSFEAEDDVWAYALQILRGVQSNLANIDTMIQTSSAHWTLKRMALVDLIIMRIAAYEMKFAADLVPPAVAINEAVEVAKRFGTIESASFVNGILDQIVKH
jgi:N utilization substance protein B